MALKRMPTSKEVEDLLWFIDLLKTWQSDDDYAEMEEENPQDVPKMETLVQDLKG